MNVITLLGRLTQEPNIKYTPSGKSLCTASIAVRRDFTKNNESDFFQLEAWEKVAEIIGKYFKKGSRIAIQGRLQNNFYDDKNGVKHYAQKIIVDKIDFVDTKKESGENSKLRDEWRGTPIDDKDMPF